MYCRRCNTIITGNYCSCCGLKVDDPWKEYRRALNAERKQFRDQYEKYTEKYHLADMCWNLANRKYGYNYNGGVTDLCFMQLKIVTMHAQKLFDIVVDY